MAFIKRYNKVLVFTDMSAAGRALKFINIVPSLCMCIENISTHSYGIAEIMFWLLLC